MKQKLSEMLKNKFVWIIAAVVLILIVVIIILCFHKNEYKKLEEKMMEAAKLYINENNIKVDNQEYIFAKDLNIKEGLELCSNASGVVVTNVEGNIEYTAYLKCIDYESKIFNNNQSYIKLKGEEVVIINLGTIYFDSGYETVTKDKINVETVGIVPEEVGAYTINYVVTKDGNQKDIAKRLVIVSEQDPKILMESLVNPDEPLILLNGDEKMILKINDVYEEPGFVAYDTVDGNLTSKVAVTSTQIDNTKEGKYSINYKVTNSRGKEYAAKREIVFVEKAADLKIELYTLEKGAVTNESEIEIKVSGDGIKKIIMPDGTNTYYTIATYKVTKNGTYEFIVEDEYNNQFTKSITVNSIDLEPPKGTCVVSKDTENSLNVITVDATDNLGVMGVDYVINGNETGFLASTLYKTKEKLNVVEAVIKDVAGNKTNISCKMNGSVNNDELYTFKYDNNKPIMKCDTYGENDRKNLENTLKNAINSAEYGSRAGAVEAARFLVGGLDYKIPYTTPKNETIDPNRVLGRYEKVGLNIANNEGWGCTVNGVVQGMDSINVIKWAFKNAGVTFNDSLDGAKKTVDVKNQIKPGDIVFTPCKNCSIAEDYTDIGIVIGVDDDKIYVVEAVKENYNSIVITEILKKSLSKDGKFSMIKQYEYEKEGDLKLMWK